MTPSEAAEFAMALMRSSFECRELIEEIDARRPTAGGQPRRVNNATSSKTI